MIKAILKKTGYTFSILWGVATLVFFLFQVQVDNPARMILGKRANPEAIAEINKELGLDLPLGKQYLLYINDLSPISIYSTDESSRIFFDDKYNGFSLIPIGGGNKIVLKAPYLRKSFVDKRSVGSIIGSVLPATLILAITAILLAAIIGISMGIVASLNPTGFSDKIISLISVLGMSSPSYFLALLFAWIGAYLWHDQTTLPMLPLVLAIIGGSLNYRRQKKNTDGVFFLQKRQLFNTTLKYLFVGIGLVAVFTIFKSSIPFLYKLNLNVGFPGTGLSPAGGLVDVDDYGDEFINLKNLILPTLTLSVTPLAIITQLTRNSLLDEYSKDYIQTARAKGLKTRTIVLKHALKNAISPVITVLSGWFANLLAGAIFVEIIFSWNGIGTKLYKAIENDNLPVIMGIVIVISTFFVVINMSVDVIHQIIDPRIRKK